MSPTQSTVTRVPCSTTKEKSSRQKEQSPTLHTSFLHPVDPCRVFRSISFEGLSIPKTFDDLPRCPSPTNLSSPFDLFHQYKADLQSSLQSMQSASLARIVHLLSIFHHFTDEQIEQFFRDMNYLSITREEIQRAKRQCHHHHHCMPTTTDRKKGETS